MVTDWLIYASPIASCVTVFVTLEVRNQKRAKDLKEDIGHMIDAKIGEYAGRVNSERMAHLERENERLREYARDKK